MHKNYNKIYGKIGLNWHENIEAQIKYLSCK